MKGGVLIKNIMIVLIGYFFLSCENDIIHDESSVNEIYVFDNNYVVKEFNLYLGGYGLVKDLDEDKAFEYWPNLNIPYSDTIIINKQINSLVLKSTLFDPVYYQIHIRNDSIFILRNDESYSFFSTFSNNKNELSGHLGFYIAQNLTGAFSYFLKGSDFELQSYNKRFYKNGIFESPDDMIDKDDLVAWCNVYYTFKKLR